MTPHITLLRQKLTAFNLDGWLLPHSDRFKGEYLVPCDEWLKWLSNFSGSAGFSIILKDKAAVFVDGRYTLQAKEQVDQHIFSLNALSDEKKWLSDHGNDHYKIGFDPWLFSEKEIVAFQKVTRNLEPHPRFLDDLWRDRPVHPKSALFQHPLMYAGVSTEEKIKNLRALLNEKKVDAVLLFPESWSWLLNLRGGDLSYTPVSQGFAFITKDRVCLFLYKADQSFENISIYPLEELEDFLKQHASLTLGYDPSQTPLSVLNFFSNKVVLEDPCLLPKACKNNIELDGAKIAHKKDAVAWCTFWQNLKAKIHTHEKLTELAIVESMLQVRQKQKNFHSLSFATIAGSGAHGAIVHYKPETSTNRPLGMNELLLIDSGAQYFEGTTDITRTLIIGKPTQEMIFSLHPCS